jgi:hypothetical protein
MGAAYDILVGTALGVGLILVFNLLRFFFGPANPFKMPPPQKVNVGLITEETLKTYAGYDITKPLLVAVRGKLYDVGKDRDVYGPREWPAPLAESAARGRQGVELAGMHAQGPRCPHRRRPAAPRPPSPQPTSRCTCTPGAR